MMKNLFVPRLDAAALNAFFRARAAERRRIAGGRIVALVRDADRADAIRERIDRAECTSRTASMFWLLHAR
jgi:hypothetical protein